MRSKRHHIALDTKSAVVLERIRVERGLRHPSHAARDLIFDSDPKPSYECVELMRHLAEAETLSELAKRWHEATRTLSKSDQRHLEMEVSKRLSVFGSVSLGKQVAQDALDEVNNTRPKGRGF